MKRYTLSQIEAFTAIVDCGTFRLASERLGITQPTISLRIRELESAIGCPLFVRGKGGVRLTEAGQVMLRYAQRGLEAFNEMEIRLKTSDPLTGVLRLGSSNTFALSCLPMVLTALEQSQSRLNVELTISNSITLGALLADHKLDIAFMADTPVPAHVRIAPLAHCEIAWCASPEMDLGPRVLRPQRLAEKRLMTMPAPSPFHTIISNWFAAARVPLPRLSFCNDMATMVRLVRAGVAASVLPLGMIAPELHAGAIVRYRGAPGLAPLTLCIAHQASARGPCHEIISRIARDAVARADAAIAPAWAPIPADDAADV
jgi:LysR family cyn operon transcriptional activator